MNTSVKFKDYNVIQKVGYILIVIAGAMTLVNFFNVFKASHFVEEELPNYIFLLGGFLVLLPFIIRRIKGKGTLYKATILLLTVCTSFGAIAQDYSKQIEAFEQSFSEKSVSPLKEYVSPTLKFDPVPAANTLAVLNNIVNNLPFKSLKIIDVEAGKAKIYYNFDVMGERESYIHFDGSGQIVRIELIENLVKQEMEQARKMRESIQQPNPGEMAAKYPSKKVVFESSDGLQVTGNLFEIDKSASVILLCHQAGYNKYEYADIAPKLNAMGYNCLAIDQRSGGTFAEKSNETFERAKEQQLLTDYIEAEKDIDTAIDFLYNKYGMKVIVWGSSYSSSLALHIASENKKVAATIAFSPGDYFGDSKVGLKEVLPKLDKPFFITSSKEESAMLQGLMKDVELSNKRIHFVPESDGFHGSRALWNGQKGADEYWNAIETFLSSIK